MGAGGIVTDAHLPASAVEGAQVRIHQNASPQTKCFIKDHTKLHEHKDRVSYQPLKRNPEPSVAIVPTPCNKFACIQFICQWHAAARATGGTRRRGLL